MNSTNKSAATPVVDMAIVRAVVRERDHAQ